MANASFPFLLFALAVVVAFNLSRRDGWRQSVLLVANVAFIALLSPSLAASIPLYAFTLFGFFCLHWVRGGGQSRLTFALCAQLFLFLWLKKYTILPPDLFLSFPYLALGLSYVLFRTLHLLIDARSGALTEAPGLVRYLNYTLNFFTFVSGPIQRYQEYATMLNGKVTAPDAGRAIERIVVGLVKARVFAVVLYSIHTQAVESALHPARAFPSPPLNAAIVFSSYTFFLYCNFSGYIDLVAGIAQLLGITLPENFNRPFSSTSFIEFWSRWHITLSSWLKDYVYLPLVSTLMRRYPQRAAEPYLGVAAYFVTFFLVGLWHGQTSAFFFFGFLQGGGVALNKLFQLFVARRFGRQGYKRFAANAAVGALSRGLTFTWFTFTLTWFWSDWTQIGALYSALRPPGAALCWCAVFAASTVALTLWEAIRGVVLKAASGWEGIFESRYLRTAWSTALVVVVLAVSILLDQPVPEIVYGKF